MTTLCAAVDLPLGEHTVRDARVLVLDLVDCWESTASRVDLALLIDDLTADVVSHAGGENDLRLELTLAGDLLRVSLADGSAIRPAVADVMAGRDPLGLLAVLAHRWGHEPYQGGHRVWFELDAEPELPGTVHDDLVPEVGARLRVLLAPPAPARAASLVGRAARRLGLRRPVRRTRN